jgi:hypothetical protein
VSTKARKTEEVDDYIARLDHPVKGEVQVLRDIIKGVNADVTEEVKWKAPSFSYRGAYLVTFNLRNPKRIRLVFHNPAIASVRSELLEGDYPDRRLAYITDMNDVKAKGAGLVDILKQLVSLEDNA